MERERAEKLRNEDEEGRKQDNVADMKLWSQVPSSNFPTNLARVE